MLITLAIDPYATLMKIVMPYQDSVISEHLFAALLSISTFSASPPNSVGAARLSLYQAYA